MFGMQLAVRRSWLCDSCGRDALAGIVSCAIASSTKEGPDWKILQLLEVGWPSV